MNILIFHNYVLRSCKYSENDIFHIQNYRKLKGYLSLMINTLTLNILNIRYKYMHVTVWKDLKGPII